ncbi:MAG TPA: hypothetical protein VGD64_10805 [Acidisarcina sp.]
MVIYRAWDHTEAVKAAQELLAIRPPRRAAIRKLMTEVCSGEPAVRKRATDLARLVSAREPGILSDYADVLLDVFVELNAAVAAQDPAAEWQSCGYLALAAAHNVTTHAQRMRLVALIRPMLNVGRNALRAMALEVFARMAAAEPELREEVLAMLSEIRFHGTPATSARARAMLALLLPGTVYDWREDWEARKKMAGIANPKFQDSRPRPQSFRKKTKS